MSKDIKKTLVILFFISLQSSAAASLFNWKMKNEKVEKWVNEEEYGGMAGVPSGILTDDRFDSHITRARILCFESDYLNMSVIFKQIESDLKDENYTSIFGWYLASGGTPVGKSLMLEMGKWYKTDQSIKNKVIAYLMKNLFESDFIQNSNLQTRNELINLLGKKADVGVKSAIFTGTIKAEVDSMVKDLLKAKLNTKD